QAGGAPKLSNLTRNFVAVDAPVVVLTHVTLIDGTGAAPNTDQTVIIRDGKIAAVGAASATTIPTGARVMDLAGHTVVPGFVGLHDHTFYTTVSRAAMKAAIDEAHKRGLKATGHLCSVSFREAVALGIDNLEHGLLTNTDYLEGKQADQCPSNNTAGYEKLDMQGPAVQQT